MLSRSDRCAGGFAPGAGFAAGGLPAEHVVGHLVGVNPIERGQVGRARVGAQERELARIGGRGVADLDPHPCPAYAPRAGAVAVRASSSPSAPLGPASADSLRARG